MRNILQLGVLLIFLVFASSFSRQEQKGLIPDEKTAIKVAEAIWLAKYGKMIYDRKPFTATLTQDTVWIVKGTVPKRGKGGNPYLEINRMSGEVYRIAHGK